MFQKQCDGFHLIVCGSGKFDIITTNIYRIEKV